MFYRDPKDKREPGPDDEEPEEDGPDSNTND